MKGEKYEAEMAYWNDRFQKEGQLGNAHYRRLMLAVTGQPDEFFAGKVVADFGSGPRGSLEWCKLAKARYCIDVLVDDYRSLGIDAHEAEYIKSSEDSIPLPDETVDIMLSINAIDHAVNWRHMMQECIRTLRMGGTLAMSINLDEAWSPAEPNTIRLGEVLDELAGRIFIQRIKAANRAEGPNKYSHLFEWSETGKEPALYGGAWGVLWFSGVRAG